ncbi:hypothetical protein [Companilactobacillus zhachilii]|uniref:hypothetical protein n=1 Tax=Companilactobacillus zhachilii TaxID=2304606 RepID=UPI0040342AB1
MKKSIKYAGIAAATLLTVAPIAAPVVSNVTTVQAAAGDADQSDVNKAITDFNNQFGDRTVDDVQGSASSLDLSKITLGKAASQDMTLAQFNTANAQVIKTPVTADITSLTNQGAHAYMVATDAKNNVYDGTVGGTNTELQKAMALDNHMPVHFVVYLQYKDLATGAYTDWTKTAEFDITKSNSDELTAVNAKFTTPLDVALNSKVAATQLVNGSNVSVTDQNGDSLATKEIAPSSSYFYTYSQAMNNAKDSTVTTGNVQGTTDAPATDVINKDGEFAKAGTYYQAIKYTAQTGSALESMINVAQTDPTKYTITVNGKKASAGYDYVMTPSSTTGTGDDATTTPASITFVRAINVSNNKAEWTTTDTTGVVTTKTDHAFYTLKDDEGNTVTNRALAKNTAWKTNAVRTDQDGNKQYRVGASEWIDANDVTFSDKATDNNGEGAYTDVKALNGKVTTAGPEGFYYPLYDDNGKMVTNRGVAGLSAWYTDKSAVNADGVTVYHVATGEWLQGTNVTYTAY